jgi:hypothetical protein
VHRLSTRSRKPFVAINCAAIPEALLEAELFGHTRGAFTGAVQGRVGRIEAADGGTLFLDEIGEMPLALQSKLLRFVECGELQRVGDNETVKVDVRIVAATHRRWPSRRRRAASAPTSTTGWRSFSSAPRRWPSTPRICRCWSTTFCAMGRDEPVKRSTTGRWPSWPRTTGRAMSASSSTCWSGAPFWPATSRC